MIASNSIQPVPGTGQTKEPESAKLQHGDALGRLEFRGPPPPPEYESKQQLASRLGVSTRTIDNLMVQGLPYLKLTGKLVRFPRPAVNDWLGRQQIRRA
jgi:excisionase family DNA binding protein